MRLRPLHRKQHLNSFTEASLSALLRANAFTPTVVRADNLRYYRSGPVARLEGAPTRPRRLTGKKEPHLVYVARKTA